MHSTDIAVHECVLKRAWPEVGMISNWFKQGVFLSKFQTAKIIVILLFICIGTIGPWVQTTLCIMLEKDLLKFYATFSSK